MPFLIILILAGLMLIVEAKPQPTIYKEYLGRHTKTSWIPTFVMYDPPGDGSYSKFTEQRTVTSYLKYGGAWTGFYASGETTKSWTVQTSYETPHDSRIHCVIAITCEQVWDLWMYTYPSRVLYKAILVSSTATGGKGIVSFDDLDEKDMWVDSLMGTQGDYRYRRYVSANCSMSDTLEYYWSNHVVFGAGYFLNLVGVGFSIYVEIKSKTSTKAEVLYHYFDSTGPLDFYLELDEKNIWFSE